MPRIGYQQAAPLNPMNTTTHPVCLALAAAGVLAAPAEEDAFPFVIPGLAAPPAGAVVDVSWLNDRPAGRHGPVRVRDGRFVDGRGQRLRFLASNVTFGSCFPDHATADRLAARMASLGLNCIRFHHADNQAAPGGIWKAGTPHRNEFDPGQLDRLDYFIAALKERGIYANLNLHVSRNYWEGEDFPDGLADNRQRQQLLPHYGKGLDKINDQMIRMQRDYARALLSHVNPHTGTSYATEPCVAMIELNNENSLLQLDVAALPEYYRAEVLRKWHAWLRRRHKSDGQLAAAWGGSEELGPNLLPAQPTIQGDRWLAVRPGGAGETHVSVTALPEVNWHAQLHWGGLTLEEGRVYTLEFSARSEAPRRLPLSTRLAQPDWHNCGLAEDAALGPQWQAFSHAFRAARVEPGAVRFDIVVGGGPPGDFVIKDLTLRRGGSLGLRPGESLAAGNIAAPSRSASSPRGLDWTRFLAETERAYTSGMRAFLRRELGVEAPVIDTQASYGGIAGTLRESVNEYVDMHAYWQHPAFPGRPWDGANWNIPNTPMVDAPDGGNLARLAVYRVAGRPFTVSEYDHPAPSHYAAEMFPMIASFGALQDWDGLFQFDWGGTDSDARRITGYFALQQHPAKLALLPAAALMFRRGDVPAATATARLAIPAAHAEELTAENVSMPDAWRRAGLTPGHLLTHRLELRFAPVDELQFAATPGAASPVAWNPAAGLYTVDAPAAKVVAGRCTGTTTTLADAEFTVAANPRNFAVLALSALDAQPLPRSRRLLLAAVGNAENTGMGWNDDHTSVGSRWGQAPTICQGIAAHVSLAATRRATVHALDGSGTRTAEVPSTLADGRLTFDIGPAFRTLWYEIAHE